jgi:AbrB family looped-hinge helix DNA binding protein
LNFIRGMSWQLKWYGRTMKTTIDRAGRVVVPKALRDELSLVGGETVELTVRDGRLEITPLSASMRLESRGRGAAAIPEQDVPPLTADQVRSTLEQTRR